jgi:hypothetical protein
VSAVEVARLTTPLALYLLLAELSAGGFATVAFLRFTGGLTRGFLKFIAVSYLAIAALGLLTVWAERPASYRTILGIDSTAAGWLLGLQALLVLALIVHTVMVWRSKEPRLTWGPGLLVSGLLLTAIAVTLAPLAGSLLDGVAIGLVVFVSAAVLGAATTGMLLGHWYLVTPALTNRPLLRSIVLLVAGLVLQAVALPLVLGGLARGSGSVSRALQISPTLSVLWGLGAVVLPLLAGILAIPTCRLRSFMSTTGLLYMAMIALIPGQLIGLLLFFVAASA